MNTGVIYKITNPNGKLYIGQTTHYSSRVSAYRNLNIRRQELIQNSIKKYGWENHEIEIICEAPPEELDQKEVYYINEYQTYCRVNPNGMNMTLGGLGSRGRKDTEEVKLKRAAAHIGSTRSEASKALMSIAKKGKPSPRIDFRYSEESKEKMRLAKLNKKQTTHTVTKRVETQQANFIAKYGAVLQIDTDGNTVKEWTISPAQLARELSIDPSFLLKCLKSPDKRALGFTWKYKHSGQ